MKVDQIRASVALLIPVATCVVNHVTFRGPYPLDSLMRYVMYILANTYLSEVALNLRKMTTGSFNIKADIRDIRDSILQQNTTIHALCMCTSVPPSMRIQCALIPAVAEQLSPPFVKSWLRP
jgi:hypothetical protein